MSELFNGDTNVWWAVGWQAGVIIITFGLAIGLIFSCINYFAIADTPYEKKIGARWVLAALFGGPPAAMIWPAVLVGAVLYGSYKLVKDAFFNDKD